MNALLWAARAIGLASAGVMVGEAVYLGVRLARRLAVEDDAAMARMWRGAILLVTSAALLVTGMFLARVHLLTEPGPEFSLLGLVGYVGAFLGAVALNVLGRVDAHWVKRNGRM